MDPELPAGGRALWHDPGDPCSNGPDAIYAAEDLEAILDALPAERQTALFSATMAPRIAALFARGSECGLKHSILNVASANNIGFC